MSTIFTLFSEKNTRYIDKKIPLNFRLMSKEFNKIRLNVTVQLFLRLKREKIRDKQTTY